MYLLHVEREQLIERASVVSAVGPEVPDSALLIRYVHAAQHCLRRVRESKSPDAASWQVGRDEVSPASGGPDRRHRLIAAGLVASRSRHVDPGRGQGDRGRPADALVAPATVRSTVWSWSRSCEPLP